MCGIRGRKPPSGLVTGGPRHQNVASSPSGHCATGGSAENRRMGRRKATLRLVIALAAGMLAAGCGGPSTIRIVNRTQVPVVVAFGDTSLVVAACSERTEAGDSSVWGGARATLRSSRPGHTCSGSRGRPRCRPPKRRPTRCSSSRRTTSGSSQRPRRTRSRHGRAHCRPIWRRWRRCRAREHLRRRSRDSGRLTDRRSARDIGVFYRVCRTGSERD